MPRPPLRAHGATSMVRRSSTAKPRTTGMPSCALERLVGVDLLHDLGGGGGLDCHHALPHAALLGLLRRV